jgi:hypothetical protein
MKNYVSPRFGAVVLVVYVAASAMVLIMGYATTAPRVGLPRAPAAEHPDATLMRPGFKVDTSGGKISIHGDWQVFRPSGLGRDHAVAVRLTIVRPDDEKVLYTEDLARIDYHRNYGRAAYRIDKELKFDASGLDVKVAAVDTADGREFASIVTHGVAVAVEPAPVPRKGE